MKLIVGITGASGAVLGIELLRALQTVSVCETHLVISKHAYETLHLETAYSVADVIALANVSYADDKMSAAIASGSFKTDGMIVIPCSMRTLAAIASGNDGNLIQRAADVCLKEGRKVVLVPREIPLNRIHLRNLNTASEVGCVILPPMLTFYHHPQSIEDMIDYLIGKIFLQFNLEYAKFKEWKSPP
ncbi:MAG: UbiX family flavin prenyltransferase [Leptolinea sp.]